MEQYVGNIGIFRVGGIEVCLERQLKVEDLGYKASG